MTIKNECLKERKIDNPYEIWRTPDGTWEWRVLKKWQVDDNKLYARWFCAVKSPFTNCDIGDVYVSEIKGVAVKVEVKYCNIKDCNEELKLNKNGVWYCPKHDWELGQK